MEETMLDADRRPMGRLFCWVLAAILVGTGIRVSAFGGTPAPQTSMTTVADFIYLADGNSAKGNLIITWPAFVTASGTAVAGGVTNVALGANGELSVALVPNAGATPAGVYYSVVFQLGPAVAAREIVEPEKFRNGVSKIIDGTVDCLNASTWCKSNQAPATSVQK
jgi:hypothetical protein